MFKKARLSKWITFLIFIAVIVFIALLTKNKGDFAATLAEIKGLFGK